MLKGLHSPYRSQEHWRSSYRRAVGTLRYPTLAEELVEARQPKLVESQQEEPVRVATEFRSYGEESSMVPTQLRGLLFQLGITRAPEYRVKGVPRLGRMEFTCTERSLTGRRWSASMLVPPLVRLVLR
jgi:hypothetical protein